MKTNILDSLPLTDMLFRTATEAKQNELQEICQKMNWNTTKFSDEAYKILIDSGMHMGACNMVLNFIIEAVRNDMCFNSEMASVIREQVLNVAVYYANGCGSDPIYYGKENNVIEKINS